MQESIGGELNSELTAINQSFDDAIAQSRAAISAKDREAQDLEIYLAIENLIDERLRILKRRISPEVWTHFETVGGEAMQREREAREEVEKEARKEFDAAARAQHKRLLEKRAQDKEDDAWIDMKEQWSRINLAFATRRALMPYPMTHRLEMERRRKRELKEKLEREPGEGEEVAGGVVDRSPGLKGWRRDREESRRGREKRAVSIDRGFPLYDGSGELRGSFRKLTGRSSSLQGWSYSLDRQSRDIEDRFHRQRSARNDRTGDTVPRPADEVDLQLYMEEARKAVRRRMDEDVQLDIDDTAYPVYILDEYCRHASLALEGELKEWTEQMRRQYVEFLDDEHVFRRWRLRGNRLVELEEEEIDLMAQEIASERYRRDRLPLPSIEGTEYEAAGLRTMDEFRAEISDFDFRQMAVLFGRMNVGNHVDSRWYLGC
jgi:hypothetical protein